MDLMLWNVALTLIIGLIAYFLREKSAELQRITILLNRTREEIAKDYVTKEEASDAIKELKSTISDDIREVKESMKAINDKFDRLLGLEPFIERRQKER